MFDFLAPSVDLVVNSNFSLVLLALIALVESIFLPLPPDIFLIPLSLLNPDLAFLYAGIATAFSILGGYIGYQIGNKGGKPLVYKFISEQKLYNVKLFYNKYDIWAILISAFSPIPYKVFTLSAGLFDLNVKRFLLASFIGRGGRFFAVAALISIFGEPIKEVLDKYFELFTIGVVLALLGGVVAANHLFKMKHKERLTTPEGK